ncbi:MAG: flagellar hook-length control protein FliK [Janthinobacterium lividum]
MNALDKIGMNLMPLRLDTMLSGIAAGMGARTAGADGGSISQQPRTLAGSPDASVFLAPRALPTASTLATVSVDARVLDALSRLPGELPLILASKPLCPVPPRDGAATAQNATGNGTVARTPLSVVGAAEADTPPAKNGAATSPATAAGAATGPGAANAALAAGAAPVTGSAFTTLLARALQQTLENSGLFYESHLAQWASGQRPISDLDREPQSHLTPLDGPATQGPTGDAPEGAPSTAAESLPQVLNHALHNVLQNALHYARANGLEFAGGDATAPASTTSLFGRTGASDGAAGPLDTADQSAARLVDAIHPEIVSTVRQQMELLQNPVLRWSGEAWPGTRMDWEIERRDERREDGSAWNADDAPVEPAWRMQVSLNLPHLGAVDADLQLAGSRLIARLKAHPDSAASLLHDSDDLRRRLAGTGLELKSLAVREMPDADGQQAS